MIKCFILLVCLGTLLAAGDKPAADRWKPAVKRRQLGGELRQEHCKVLQRHNVATTPEAVLAYLQKAQPQPASGDRLNPLIQALGAAASKDRQAASRDLAALGLAVAPRLLRAAESSDPEVRVRARELLAQFRERSFTEPLAAALALVGLDGDPAGFGIALAFLRCAEALPPTLQRICIRTLVACSRKSDLPRLRRLLHAAQPVTVREGAMAAVSRLQPNPAAALVAFLKDKTPQLRLMAAERLAVVGDKRCLRVFLDILSDRRLSALHRRADLALRDILQANVSVEYSPAVWRQLVEVRLAQGAAGFRCLADPLDRSWAYWELGPPAAAVNLAAFTMLPHFVDQQSDTLREIAEMYGSRVDWILAANPGLRTDVELRQVKEIQVPVEDLKLNR